MIHDAVKTAIIILAAGASSRFGGVKALAPWNGHNLLSHAYNTARSVGTAAPFVVLGGHAEQLAPFIEEDAIVFNADWVKGIGTSIVSGTGAALAKYSDLICIVILPVDQPLVTKEHLENLIEMAVGENKCTFTRDRNVWGPPVAIPKSSFKVLSHLNEHQGLKALVDPEHACFIESRMLADVDRPEDLTRLQSMQEVREKE